MMTEAKAEGKSKTTAVLLGIIPAGLWTWLYTYKRDAWKFWVGFWLILVFGAVYLVLTYPVNAGDALAESNLATVYGIITIITWVLVFVIWVWAFLDAVVKKSEWYRAY